MKRLAICTAIVLLCVMGLILEPAMGRDTPPQKIKYVAFYETVKGKDVYLQRLWLGELRKYYDGDGDYDIDIIGIIGVVVIVKNIDNSNIYRHLTPDNILELKPGESKAVICINKYLYINKYPNMEMKKKLVMKLLHPKRLMLTLKATEKQFGYVGYDWNTDKYYNAKEVVKNIRKDLPLIYKAIRDNMIIYAHYAHYAQYTNK